ncbi:hypothetical protein [Streptomyces sp. NPDC051921]|uniref:hypothetical protein n=1 Tax=Streptomyces sp. NPDC051921 TaxID=3155806 RepID=UPI00343E2CD2
MLRPSTESPSRDARPPRRPGVVVLPVAALAAILALSVAVTAHGGGGSGDGDLRATPLQPSAAGPDTPQDPDDGAGEGARSRPRGQQPSAQGESPSPLPAGPSHRTSPSRTDRGRTDASASGSPTASAAPTGTVRPRPRPTATRRDPAAQARTSYDALRVGDCFDIDRDAPGTVVRRGCDAPHDAELVARLRLTGRFADDEAVRDAAAALCRAPLRAKAAEQPLGTRWTTFVQYPYRTSYLLGTDTVACSLAVPSGTGRKLTAPLQ